MGNNEDLARSEADPAFDPEDPENWVSLDYVHDQVLAQLKAQSDRWDAIDSRLRALLGVVGIIFAAAFGLQRGTTLLPFWVGLLVLAAVIMFLVSVVAAAIGYWPAEFNRPPEPSYLRNTWLTADERGAKIAVVDQILEEYGKNGQILKRKLEMFERSFRLLTVAIVLMGVALAVQTTLNTAW